ncbi:class F sortase [Nonomuraea sp. NN258]|uniref:class F sortase n=1 Tax=Nonomuraea antri TaxID=2730852 RepID=UPI0015689FEC|nr:class F sortase [Nonomuraea antri]NRQ30754.1 class F sortase [Nonomuraea antri]
MSGHYPYGGAPVPPEDKGSTALRTVLIVAAIAGIVTVVAGLLIVVKSPEEYGLAARDTLELQAQPKEKASGQPQQALFQAAPEVPAPLPPIKAAPAMLPSSPTRLIIRKLGINAPVKSLGLAKDGTIQVPAAENSNLVGWYRNMSTPGEAGPAVMLGHKDTRTRSAVFSRLYELKNGDTIEVKRQDGITAVFQVGGIEQANKKTFPTQRVYGTYENAQLHLITCGGTYDRTSGHYTDNIIVYATMTSSYRS